MFSNVNDERRRRGRGGGGGGERSSTRKHRVLFAHCTSPTIHIVFELPFSVLILVILIRENRL